MEDQQKFKYDSFKDLYHDRWPIEEDYKVMKCRIEIENFSGKSVLSVYQDFHAKVFSKNIIAAFTFSANEEIATKTEDCKHKYKTNFTHAISNMKHAIVLLFIRLNIKELIQDMHEEYVKIKEPIRPNRSYPRYPRYSSKEKNPVKIQGFYVSYKRTA